MRSRGVLVIAAAIAVLTTTASGPAVPNQPAPLIVDVDPHRPVFAGIVAVDVSRPAARLEIVLVGTSRPVGAARNWVTAALLALMGGSQTDGAAHERVTAALTALAQNTLPHATVEPLPEPAQATGHERIFRDSPPGVRIRMPMPATDKAVRESVSRILEAVNSRRYGDDTYGARIISIDHIFADCTPFDEPTRHAGQTRVEQLAQAIGLPSATGVTLQRLPAARPFEAPAQGMPRCAGGSAIFPDASLPSSASYRNRQAFAFAQPIRFAIHASASHAHDVRALSTGPTNGPHLNLRASDVLLTVEGNAVLERRPAGTLYVYDGPNGRYHMSDLTIESLRAIRRHLRAAGIADAAIATQLDPDTGHRYVRVRSPNIRWNKALAAAISGPIKSEQDAVNATAFGDTCADEQHTLARAVADAQARARRIATGLGASIDPTPVAVRPGAGIGFASCTDRGTEYTPPVPHDEYISGQLQRRELAGDEAVSAFVVFRIGHPHLFGAVRSHVGKDKATNTPAGFGEIAPPIDYPDTQYAGDAQLQTQLRPQRIRVDMLLSPDNRHGFRAIDRRLAAGLAATLGASSAQYTASFIPDNARGAGVPMPDQMIFDAEFPNHGTATNAALDAALASAQAAGYGGFSIVPESDGCAAVDDALALDAIRTAAQNTLPSQRTGRVIAIDLRGPFTINGLCGPTNSAVPTWAIRNATITDVRLGAYARVSYGR